MSELREWKVYMIDGSHATINAEDYTTNNNVLQFYADGIVHACFSLVNVISWILQRNK